MQKLTPVYPLESAKSGKRAHELAKEDPRPLEVLALIKELYALEAQARDEGLSWQERGELRQEKSLPIARRLKECILPLRQELVVTPGTAFAKACDYAPNPWFESPRGFKGIYLRPLQQNFQKFLPTNP